MQETIIFTRRGKGGAVREQVAPVIACFEHASSRSGDPQLHVHALFCNVGVRTDGSVGTIESKPFYINGHMFGALFRAQLAANLKQRLGLTITASNIGFGIAGVPDSLNQAFATRRAQIEKELSTTGRHGAAASEAAALATRSKKQLVSRTDLFSVWQKQGVMHGFTGREASLLIDTAPRTIDEPQKMQTALKMALISLTEHQSDFLERDLLKAIAVQAPNYGLSARAVREVAASAIAQKQVVALQDVPETRYTTKTMLQLEARLLDVAGNLASGFFAGCGSVAIKEAARTCSRLSAEQTEALDHLTNRGSRVRMLAGLAGTGKTSVLLQTHELLKQHGYCVIGTAVAARAAHNLQDSTGIQSRTLHSLLAQIASTSSSGAVSNRTVIIVDEAGTIGSRQMCELLTAVDSAGATILLVGDEKQLQPIAAGGSFAALCRRYGAASLHTIRRQKEDWHKQAVSDMASGKSATALQAFTRHGSIVTADNHESALTAVIDRWKLTGVAVPKTSLIVANCRRDVAQLNSLAQRSRQAAGMLGSDAVMRHDGTFYKNDRVVFSRNDRKIGVRNGEGGTVIRTSPAVGQLTVILDAGGVVTIDASTPLALGYARTTFSSQGSTVAKTFALLSGGQQDLHSAYVQVSRATDSTDLVIDAEAAGEELGDLIRQLRTTHTKGLAIDNLMPAPQPLVQAGPIRRLSL